MTHITAYMVGVFALSVVLAPVAIAETATTSPLAPNRSIKKEIREEREGYREEIKNATSSEERKVIRAEEKEQLKEMRTEALDAKRRGIIERHIKIMGERFQAAIERLGRLADRIDARIVKLEEKGFDLSEAEAKLPLARTAIDEAVQAAEDAEAALEAALTSEDPKAAFESVRAIVKTVQEKL